MIRRQILAGIVGAVMAPSTALAEPEILYAEVYKTPGWEDMVVYDLDTGLEVKNASVCNVRAGMIFIYGRDGRWRTIERVWGRFKIVRRRG